MKLKDTWRKAMANLDSILKSRDIVNKGPSSQSYGFSRSHVWMWELDYKEHGVPKNWWFWIVVLDSQRVPWTARRANQSILKEINPEYSWEGLMLKLKLVGIQPRWIQGDSKVGTASASLGKYIFNYRYRERLETDSVVGNISGEKEAE